MKRHRPSPAMVVSIIALVMATTGSAIAAVDFARNAGAVDGKSAVSAGATLKQASGRLVAAQKTGAAAGKIKQKFLLTTAISVVVFGVIWLIISLEIVKLPALPSGY